MRNIKLHQALFVLIRNKNWISAKYWPFRNLYQEGKNCVGTSVSLEQVACYFGEGRETCCPTSQLLRAGSAAQEPQGEQIKSELDRMVLGLKGSGLTKFWRQMF